MSSTLFTPPQDPDIAASTPDDMATELRPWTTPRLQRLNGSGTEGGFIDSDTEIGSYQPS